MNEHNVMYWKRALMYITTDALFHIMAPQAKILEGLLFLKEFASKNITEMLKIFCPPIGGQFSLKYIRKPPK